MVRLWFTDYRGKYKGDEPSFYPSKKILLIQFLEANYSALLEELKVLWENEASESDHLYLKQLDVFDDKKYPPSSWKKLMFYIGGLKNKTAYSRFPVTASIIEGVPAVMACFISKISAQSVIKPHCGEVNAIIRVHLGLHVPVSDVSVCGIEVGNEQTGWQNGKAFAFLDAHEHHVWNRSEFDRYVLIMDILRPEFADQKKFIISRAVVNKLYFFAARKLKISRPENIQAWVLDFFAWIFCKPIFFSIWLINRIVFLQLPATAT